MGKNTKVQTAFEQVLAATDTIPAKQKQVLAASLALFAEQGFANTTTKQIAARAGVAEGTVYRRYQTKDELLEALLKPLVTEVMPQLMKEFASQVVAQDYLTRHQFLTVLVDNRRDFLKDNWREVKILVNEMMIHDDLRNRVITNGTPVIRQNLFPVLDKLKAAGELVDWPNDLIAQFIIGTVLTNLIRSILVGDLTTFSDRVPELVTFLDKGLAPA